MYRFLSLFIGLCILSIPDFALSQNSKETIEKRRIENYVEKGSGTFYLNDEVGIKKASAAYSLDVYSNDADWLAQFDQDNASGLGVLINMDSNSTAAAFRVTGSGGTILSLQSRGFLGVNEAAPDKTLDVEGGFGGNVVNVTTGTYTNTNSDAIAIHATTGGGSVTFQGLEAGADGQVIHVFKTDSSNSMILVHESGSASAGDKIKTPGSVDITFTGKGGSTLVYYGSHWNVVSFSN